MIKDTKYRLLLLFGLTLLNLLCTCIVFIFHIETTLIKIISSYVAIGLVTAVTWRLSKGFFNLCMGFVALSSPLGSTVNLYYHLPFYDFLIHYLSGIVLAAGGVVLVERYSQKHKISFSKIFSNLFALFFSCSGAAFWEIYEYSADSFFKTDLQGTKANTMGDIIAGTLGAATHFIISFIVLKRKKGKNCNNL